MDEETTKSDSAQISNTNAEIDDADTNLEKESIQANSSKESNIPIEKKNNKKSIDKGKKDDRKSIDKEKKDVKKSIDKEKKDDRKSSDKEKIDINTKQENVHENMAKKSFSKLSFTNSDENEQPGSLFSEGSTNAEKLFDDVDENAYTETETPNTQTTDFISNTGSSESTAHQLTLAEQNSIYDFSDGDDEFEEDKLITKISELSVEEEESDDTFGYLEGFSRATDTVGTTSIAVLERQANESELYKLCEQQAQSRRKYTLLNKKISEYFKKKKVDRVFADISPDFYNPMLEKYERKLDEFNDIYNEWIREKTTTDNEINDMLKLKAYEQAQLNKHLKALTMKEKEIGNILLETGAVQEKVVERLISRQKAKSGKMAIVRIAYIKQRDKVKKIEMRIKDLETIGGNFHLMDFEQLRMENTIYSDKIEERDEELMRLRDRYSHAIQALAHIREKCSVMEAKIEDTKDENIRTEDIVSEIREQLNDLKIERDNNRSQTHKLKVGSGLLNYPSLLIDMESSLKIADVYKHELESIQAAYKENRIKLKALRYCIEHQTGKNSTHFGFHLKKSSYPQTRKRGSQQRRLEAKIKTQYDNHLSAMKTKFEKIFADKNCCPIIPKTRIIETIK